MTAGSRRPVATLSLDLDNLWAYLRSNGDASWRTYPSFLDIAIPRILAMLDELGLTITVFVVGRDAESRTDAELLRRFVVAGHEIANHSYDHDSLFHRLHEEALEGDFNRSEAAIASLGCERPLGFRGPSFRLSTAVLRTLSRRGYHYDASTFPTSAGPLARAWQRAFVDLDPAAREALKDQYGSLADARRPLAPYTWRLAERDLLEIPVSTMPLTRLPVHWTYLHFLSSMGNRLASSYVRVHIALCRATEIPPSLLLHATDFLGADDACCPRFLPGMRRTAAQKMALLRATLALYSAAFELAPLGRYALARMAEGALARHEPVLSRPT